MVNFFFFFRYKNVSKLFFLSLCFIVKSFRSNATFYRFLSLISSFVYFISFFFFHYYICYLYLICMSGFYLILSVCSSSLLSLSLSFSLLAVCLYLFFISIHYPPYLLFPSYIPFTHFSSPMTLSSSSIFSFSLPHLFTLAPPSPLLAYPLSILCPTSSLPLHLSPILSSSILLLLHLPGFYSSSLSFFSVSPFS